jgi:hypothetical protein
MDYGFIGAAWVFTRSGATWTQQASKLVGSGASGPFVEQGSSVALSADCNTTPIGRPFDNYLRGAAWVFTLSSGTWTQQGNKLVGTGAIGNALQGGSVALSGDSDTALIGAPNITIPAQRGCLPSRCWVQAVPERVITQRELLSYGPPKSAMFPSDDNATAMPSWASPE